MKVTSNMLLDSFILGMLVLNSFELDWKLATLLLSHTVLVLTFPVIKIQPLLSLDSHILIQF